MNCMNLAILNSKSLLVNIIMSRSVDHILDNQMRRKFKRKNNSTCPEF